MSGRTRSRSRSRERSYADSYDSRSYTDYSDSFVSETDSEYDRRMKNKKKSTLATTNKKNPLKSNAKGGKKLTPRGNPTTPRGGTQIKQRMMSAKQGRLKQIINEKADLETQLEEIRQENRLLKRQHFLQDKAINKYESQDNSFSEVLHSHSEEVRALREQVRRQKQRAESNQRKIKDKDEEIFKLQKRLKKLDNIVHDRSLGERDDLNRQLAKTELELEEKVKRVKDLEKHLHYLEKNHRRELAQEMAKNKDSDKSVEELTDRIQRLEIQLKEKEKALDIKNIYSNRKPPHRLSGFESSLSSPTPTPPKVEKKRRRSSSPPRLTPRELAKQLDNERREKEKKERESRLKANKTKSPRTKIPEKISPRSISPLREHQEDRITNYRPSFKFETYKPSNTTTYSKDSLDDIDSNDCYDNRNSSRYDDKDDYNYYNSDALSYKPKLHHIKYKGSDENKPKRYDTFSLGNEREKRQREEDEARRQEQEAERRRKEQAEKGRQKKLQEERIRKEEEEAKKNLKLLKADSDSTFFEKMIMGAKPNDKNKHEQEEKNRREREEREREERERKERVAREQEQLRQDREKAEQDRFKREAELERAAAEREREEREKEARLQFEHEERERREREDQQRRDREATERREREEKERWERENRHKEDERRKQKDLLLAKMKQIDNTDGHNGADLSPASRRKQDKEWTFSKPIENLHSGKSAYEDVKVPYLEKQKKEQKKKLSLFDDDDNDDLDGGYQPSFGRRGATDNKSKKNSLFDDDSPSSSAKNRNGFVFGSNSPKSSANRNHKKKNDLLGDLFGNETKSRNTLGDEDIFASSTKAKPVTQNNYPWEKNVAVSNSKNNSTALNRPRQQANVLDSKPAVNAIDSFDVDDIEEVVL
ncbi:unnamed protein product [Owenia fusiformis]|uniref:Uncharacterized protein n=1 Tax=Owenia fusiformis TaxID=6347 RepID=A0A8J1TBA5_OWEFU|nr:unnamed protein product [Owenia fusiformis]